MTRMLSLPALLLAIGLLASRTGLVLHEIGGHWGPAAAFGCTLGEIRLFVFGGGWVEFACTRVSLAHSLVIDLGGIALQLVLGAALMLAARRRPDVGRRSPRTAGAAPGGCRMRAWSCGRR